MNIEKIESDRADDRQLMTSIAQDGGSLCPGIGSVEITWREGLLNLVASNKILTPVQCRKLAVRLQEILQEDDRLMVGYAKSATKDASST